AAPPRRASARPTPSSAAGAGTAASAPRSALPRAFAARRVAAETDVAGSPVRKLKLPMRRPLALPLLFVLPLAGCGGGKGAAGGPAGMVAAPPSIADHGAAAATGGRIAVRMGDDYFRPSVVRAPAGSRVAIALENVGEVAHAFDVAGDGQKVDVIVKPGGRGTVRVRVPRTGRLLFFCKLHWSRGMAGYLEPKSS